MHFARMAMLGLLISMLGAKALGADDTIWIEGEDAATKTDIPPNGSLRPGWPAGRWPLRSIGPGPTP